MVILERDECDDEGYCKRTVLAKFIPLRVAVDQAKRLIQVVPKEIGSPCYTVTFDHLGYRVHVSYCQCVWARNGYYVSVSRTPLHLCHDYPPLGWAS